MTEEPLSRGPAGAPPPSPSPAPFPSPSGYPPPSGYSPPSGDALPDSRPVGDTDVGERNRTPWIAAGIVAAIAALAVVFIVATAGESDSLAERPAINETPLVGLPTIPGLTVPSGGAGVSVPSQGGDQRDILVATFPVPPTAVETTDPSVDNQRRWETDLTVTTVESFYSSELSNLGYVFGPSDEPAAEPATPPGGASSDARAYDVRDGAGVLVARVTLTSDPNAGTIVVLTAP